MDLKDRTQRNPLVDPDKCDRILSCIKSKHRETFKIILKKILNLLMFQDIFLHLSLIRKMLSICTHSSISKITWSVSQILKKGSKLKQDMRNDPREKDRYNLFCKKCVCCTLFPLMLEINFVHLRELKD
jgi:hypothetical protein